MRPPLLAIPALLAASALALAVPGTARAAWPAQGALVLGLPEGATHSRPIPYDVVEDGAGGLFAVWQVNAMQRLGSNGSAAAGWPAAGRYVKAHNGPPRMVGDGVGGVYVGGFGGPVAISRVTASGATAAGWPEDGIELSTASTAVSGPLLASDGTGGAFATWWEQPVGEDSRIVIQRIGADGSTSAPVPIVLLASAAYARPLGLVPDGVGGVFLAYATQYGTGQDDLYAQRVSHDLQALWPGTGVVVSAHGGAQMNPAMTPDGFGGVYVAWGDSRYDPSYPYDLRILVTRLDGAGARVAGWPATGLHAGLGSTGMGLGPQLLRNGDGTLFVGWRAVTSGAVAYLQKLQPSGAIAAGWPAAGVPISTRTNPEPSAAALEDFAVESAPGGTNGLLGFGMIADGAGGVYATWLEGTDVIAQRVDQDGAPRPGWDAAGLTVASARTEANRRWDPALPGIVPDGLGGAIVTWREAAYVPKYEWDEEIRAAHVLAGGAIVGVGDAALAAPALALAPNPSAGAFRAAITLADAGPARLELFDLQGRRVESHALAGVGRHVVTLGARSPLPSGVYVARLQAGSRTLVARAAVVR